MIVFDFYFIVQFIVFLQSSLFPPHVLKLLILHGLIAISDGKTLLSTCWLNNIIQDYLSVYASINRIRLFNVIYLTKL